jgi:hypothetical protein
VDNAGVIVVYCVISAGKFYTINVQWRFIYVDAVVREDEGTSGKQNASSASRKLNVSFEEVLLLVIQA